MRIDKVTTCSFVERESRLLQYVQDRSVVDVDKADLSFDVFYQDTTERHGRIPMLQDLYHKKMESLRAFQSGKDVWKSR